MIRRFFARPGAVFALIFAWKVALLVFLALPVPSNDAFFYDGPVVNLLLNGKYANPSLALALPISGTEVFCAYPPLYQFVLLGWMASFGASVISAMALHLALFGCYMLLLAAIFRRLELPRWAAGVAGVFLLLITFHDRPDSLAHVFGIAAVYAWIRSRRSLVNPETGTPSSGWAWTMAVLAVLGLCTGMQIGAVYCLLLWLGMLATTFFARERFPLAPMLGMVLAPFALLMLVVFGLSHLWTGFLEHARQTPSLTGWRLPEAGDLLKMARTVPGILGVAALLPWAFHARRKRVRSQPRLELDAHPSQSAAVEGAYGCGRTERLWFVTLTCTLAGLAIAGASLVLLTPNSVPFASYVQPLVVGGFLAFASGFLPKSRLRLLTCLFVVLAAIGSIRAIGLSTWGVVCARDVGYSSALHRVRADLGACTSGNKVVLSSAYLYEAARHRELTWIHSDWMEKAERGHPNSDWEGLTTLRPTKLILTQFDYYRRYEPLLGKLKMHPDLGQFETANTARVPAPDSIRPLRRILQHISWAPVVVTLSWKSAPPADGR